MDEDFSLFANDPLYRLLGRFGLTYHNKRLHRVRSILFFLGIIWVTPFILAVIQGFAINIDPKKSFLYDFAAYSQFFVAIPFFIIAEGYIENEIKYGIQHFLTSSIIPNGSLSKVKNKLKVATKNQALVIPAILLYILGHIFTWFWLWGEITNQKETWHATVVCSNCIEKLTYAGLWVGLISVPIMVYWHLRWIWKIGVWYWVLWKISRAKLQIHASHPDQFGGLGFLAHLQSRFGIILFTDSFVIAGTISYKLIIEGPPFDKINILEAIILYTVIAPLLFLLPLFFFNHQLSRKKREDLLKYSAVANYRAMQVDKDLIETIGNSNRIPIKESMDELSSLKTFYENANKMRTLPLDFQNLRRLFVSALSPMLGPIITLIVQWAGVSPNFIKIIKTLFP
jgi:hypothetical protein